MVAWVRFWIWLQSTLPIKVKVAYVEQLCKSKVYSSPLFFIFYCFLPHISGIFCKSKSFLQSQWIRLRQSWLYFIPLSGTWGKSLSQTCVSWFCVVINRSTVMADAHVVVGGCHVTSRSKLQCSTEARLPTNEQLPHIPPKSFRHT